LLSNAGYIEYEEEREYHSALHFILQRDALYRLHETDEQTEQVIQAVLRNYPGVFSGFVYIEETFLSHETGLTPGQIYQILKVLSQNRIIDFIPRRNTPTVGYPIARVDTELISLPPIVYKDRKADFQQRIDAIANYAMSSNTCRSRLLLRYFGETTSRDCGHCDVCRAKQRNPETEQARLQDAISTITNFLQDGEYHSLTDLKTLSLQPALLQDALREMTQQELLQIDGMKIKLK
jgi:ATP-dependent DNA helicase RecQ